MLSFEISGETIKKLKEVSELASEKAVLIDSLASEVREAIHRYARISTIGATTRIENAVLTDTEVDWLDTALARDARPTSFQDQKEAIKDKLSKDKERSIEEVAGCRNMLAVIYAQAADLFPLTEITVRGLHQELLQFYPPASPYLGRYKIGSNSVVEMVGSKVKRVVFQTADPGPVTAAAMRDLVQWYNETLPDFTWSLAVACELVFRFLAIHPFQDGNGRVGRGLFAFSLLHAPDRNLRKVIPFLAVDRQIEINRQEYYLVLRQCSGGKFNQNPATYRMEHFLKFMIKMIREALSRDVGFYATRHQSFLDLAPAARNVLACFREHPETRLMTGDILREIRIPRRTAIHSINQLMKVGFLQRYGQGAGTQYQLTF